MVTYTCGYLHEVVQLPWVLFDLLCVDVSVCLILSRDLHLSTFETPHVSYSTMLSLRLAKDTPPPPQRGVKDLSPEYADECSLLWF